MNDQDKLRDLVVSGDYLELRDLLSSGANPDGHDSRGWTPLHWAAQEADAAIIRIWVEAGAEVEARDEAGITPLYIAVGEDNLENAGELLGLGASPNVRVDSNEGGSVLHLAAAWGYFEMVRLLVEVEGINLNQRDDAGRTPLVLAKNGGFEAMAAWLIQRGAKD